MALTFKQIIMISNAAPDIDDARQAFISLVLQKLPPAPTDSDVRTAIGGTLSAPAPPLASFGNVTCADSAQVKPSAVREPRTATGSDSVTAKPGNVTEAESASVKPKHHRETLEPNPRGAHSHAATPHR